MTRSNDESMSDELRRLGLPNEPTARALLSLVDETVSRLDRKGRILAVRLGSRAYVSDVESAALDDFEHAPDHFVTDLVDRGTQATLLEAIEQALRTGERVDVAFSTNATGRLLHLSGSCMACGPDEVIWLTRDLTAQYDAQAASHARAELEALVSDQLQSLIDVDADTLERVMASVMREMAQHFGAVSSFLRRFRDPSHVELVCQWRAPHISRPRMGRSRAGARTFPWAARELAKHPVLVVSQLGALGPEAQVDVQHRMAYSSGGGLVWIRTGPPKRPTGIFGLVFEGSPPSDDPDYYEPLVGLAHTMLAIANRQLDTTRRELQHRVFEFIARGAPINEVLVEVGRFRESGWPGQQCIVWLPGADGVLHPVPSSPGDPRLQAVTGCSTASPEALAFESGVRAWITRNAAGSDALGEVALALGANAIEVIPLVATGRPGINGVLAVYDTSDDPIDPETVEEGFSGLGASLATIAIDRSLDLAELSHQAAHDALTGLANRATFLDRLEHALERAAISGELTAVLYCDVDRFKEVNDRLGHSTGDFLLRRIGENVVDVLPETATVARLGGDEFAILLEDMLDEDEAVAIAEQIRVTVRELQLQRNQHASISVGVAVSGAGADHADGLLRDADMAMYQAKSGGRDRVEVFRERIRREAQDRDRLSRDLASAIDNRELEVHFQPMVALASHSLVGFEALARWTHPERGNIPPDVFVPIAESSGLIVALGDFVLDEALKTAESWNDLDLHVNLSAHQVDSPGSVGALLERIARSSYPTEKVAMEITESVLLSDSITTSRSLGLLLDAGVGLVLDDFGTGYASLTYLQRFPFRGIKVDKSFVAGLNENADDLTIVSMVLGLAASLQLDVVAEGVETQHQEELLASMGCARVQGFRYSPAVPAAELPALIERLS